MAGNVRAGMMALALSAALLTVTATGGCSWRFWPFGGRDAETAAPPSTRAKATRTADKRELVEVSTRSPDISRFAYLRVAVEAPPELGVPEDEMVRVSAKFVSALAGTPARRLALVEEAVETQTGRTLDATLVITRRERQSGVAAPMGQTATIHRVEGLMRLEDGLDGKSVGLYALEAQVASGGPFPATGLQDGFERAEMEFATAAARMLGGEK